ncbi:MAG: helix-turn-helix domain-containing protein, partial [Rhodobacteraceae bacterium]|nr:helix-turn-helix domain-containing protein [Paracoccaceae bacterium]
IHLPPLRDRAEDVNEIAERLIAQMAAEEGHVFDSLSPQVRALFRTLPWPGNVRQLINVLRNVVVLNEGPQVTVGMLPPDLLADRPAPSPATDERPRLTAQDLAGRTLAQIERIVIEDALARHGDSVPKAARELDVSASTIYRKREAWEKAEGRK